MTSYEPGHKEHRTDLPDPLARHGVWSFGTLALPAPLLSAASACVLVVVWVFFHHDSNRLELFRLPFPYTALIAGSAAALAWVIAAVCRKRPGRPWPRVWALLLATTATTLTILGLVMPENPEVLALAVSSLAAAATLAPRLARVRPHSPMVQNVAPLTLAVVLFVILPSSCAVRNSLAAEAEDRVDRHIRQLRVWKVEVDEIRTFGWSRMEETPDPAAERVDQLRRLGFETASGDPDLWRAATILGKDEALSTALQALTDSVVAGLDPNTVPRVSALKEPAVRWNHHDKRWESYSRFAGLSEIAGKYHQEMGRLFRQLAVDDQSVDYEELVRSREHYSGQKSVVDEHLRAAGTWADGWAAVRVDSEARVPSLYDVFRTPFAGGYSPGDLWSLTALPMGQLREIACESGNVRGCRCLSYPDDGINYFRLDCYAYAPAAEGAGAELRMEMRLVYGSEPGRAVDERSWPLEVFFHFLVPPDHAIDNFREEVMADLSSAVRASSGDGNIRYTDRGTSAAGGFEIVRDGRVVRVYRPRLVALRGLEPEQRALEVRVERTNQQQRLAIRSGRTRR